MIPASSWRDHFKIEDKTVQTFWEEFSESSPLRASELSLATADQSIEFVLWCIREGLFSEEAFTHYQSQLSNLPVVLDGFFETPVDYAFWDRVKDLHPWNAQCLPLTDWDGTILIGSVWPEGTFKPSLRHRLVLGTPSNLRDYFSRFQMKSSSTVTSTPIAAPIATPAPVVAVSAPAPVAEFANESASDDPFAAMSRELGVAAETDHDDSHGDLGNGTDGQAEESEALVIPEGLSFTKEELARITGLDINEVDSKISMKEPVRESEVRDGSAVVPEGGTLVHNFETGDRELVEKKSDTLTNADQFDIKPLEMKSVENALPTVSEEKSAFELSPSEEADGLSLSDDFDPDKTQPSAVVKVPPPPLDLKPSAAKTPSAPTRAPFMPFAPQVTPERPAMVTPPAPVPPPPAVPTKPAFAPQGSAPSASTSPVAEATVVVNAEEALTLETSPKPRRPLFEPAAAPSVPSGSPSATSAGHSNTDAGTGTGATRSRRLESTPVTSFFGMNGTNPGIQRVGQTSAKTPGARPDHTGRVVSVNKIEPLHLDQCSTVDEAGAQAILQVCNVYETSMILLFKDGELQPWKWNDLFLSVKGDKADSIELKDPSIFKVVFRTAKPYHGYIVTSPVNQKFFNEFYRGMLPKHGSVIPIMIDGRMGGMLVGFTNSKVDYRQSLRLMERLAFDLARVFKSIRANSSAKAS